MKEIMKIDASKCSGCNACIRSCPVNEAIFTASSDDGKNVYSINNDKCIGCGQCIAACPREAVDYADDVELCFSRIANEKLIVIADPAIRTAYPSQWKGILDWFKRKKCMVYDGGFGADIHTWALYNVLESKKASAMISEPCSSVLNYISMYKPSLMKNLAPVHSLSICSAVYIRNYLQKTDKIALLSPCIAKKFEFQDTGIIDYNLTLKKVMEYFAKNGIQITNENYSDLDYDFEDKEQGQLGVLCARPGGLKDAVLNYLPEFNAAFSSGLKVYSEIDLFGKTSEKRLPDLFDALGCEYGCSGGSGTGNTTSPFDMMAASVAVEADVRAKMAKNKGRFRGNEDKLFKRFDDELELEDFLRTYKSSRASSVPSEDELKVAYKSLSKRTEEERNHNCGACGYKTCREMATAIYRELNTPDNCIMCRMKKSGGMSEEDKKALNEKLERAVKSAEDIISRNNIIGESNAKIAEKEKGVNSLLANVVAFCEANPSMDEKAVSQMKMILEKIIESLKAFDENNSATKESFESITSQINDIKMIVESISSGINK